MNVQIDHTLEEIRRFRPSPEFAAQAVAGPELAEAASADRLAFWADQARSLLTWSTPFTRTLDWTNPPFAKWFDDGELNVAVNCLDRHVEAGNGDRVALHFEGEPGDSRSITYAELTAEVKRAANVLIGLGVKPGDRVAVYMPLIPEAVVAMLAIARVGAIHSVVFGGFSADSLASRIDDAEASVVITADGGYRKGKVFPLKPTVDEAVAKSAGSVGHVLVVRRGENEVDWFEGRDHWWHELAADASDEHVAPAFNAEHPLFILYTSGTTGKPKGILHTSGGYLTQAAFTHKNVFDLHPETDVYWCTADVGWITGHSYVVYGPLANGATQVIYEGTPDTPHAGRWWEIIEKYGVTIFYTAPTAIRSFMKAGRQIPQSFNLRSLRVLGSVGEPINPEAWIWYRHVIGGGSIPVVDTWWQTETGAIMISALPGITDLKPGSAQVPVPGISIDVLTDEGEPVDGTNGGLLTVTEPWPSMLRGIWGDPQRFQETYWDKFGDRYFAGDDRWTIERGSVLDARYVESLGPFDIVYSWGVLHHTGDMWLALENAAKAVGDAGQLFIAIYNQQGYKSRWWLRVKQIYCSGLAGRALICALFVPYFWATTAAASVVLRRNLFAERKKDRGMSIWHDWIDWLGGLPFEVARPEEIFDFYRDRGFELQSLKTTNGLGNNEFVFGRR